MFFISFFTSTNRLSLPSKPRAHIRKHVGRHRVVGMVVPVELWPDDPFGRHDLDALVADRRGEQERPVVVVDHLDAQVVALEADDERRKPVRGP